MRRTILLLLICLLLSASLMGQIGGSAIYEFLNLPTSGKVASLGGKVNALPDNDLNLVFHNPSLLNQEMDNQLVLNYVNYFADINFGYLSYAKSFDRLGIFAAGLHYIHYGTFISADETGQKTGNFSASEYAFNLYYARDLDSLFSVGVNLKPIISNLEKYNSFGLAADLGVTYHNSSSLFTAALVLKNIGIQITTYDGETREPLPFEIQLGLSQKLKHAPFRISLVAHNLQKYRLTYDKEDTQDSAYDPFSDDSGDLSKVEDFAENIIRHLIFGLEFTPFESFSLRAGYNYQRRKELQVPSKVSTVGFSWGIGIQVYKFQFSYGRATYHLAGASNHFSISTNIGSFYKKADPIAQNL